MTASRTGESERSKGISVMLTHEAVEIRFTAVRSRKRWQLLAHVTQAGTIAYTLHTDPHGNYSHSFPSSLNLTNGKSMSVPMKAYEGWQNDLILYLRSIKTMDGDEVYELDAIF